MTEDSKMMTWVGIIAVIVVLIGLGWWYFATQNTSANKINTNSNPNSTQQQTKSSQKTIASFNFQGRSTPATVAINDANYTILVTIPKNTDLKTLTPVITVSENATISPTSGTTQDFSKPVTYTVTAEDGSKQNYIVTVQPAAI